MDQIVYSRQLRGPRVNLQVQVTFDPSLDLWFIQLVHHDCSFILPGIYLDQASAILSADLVVIPF